jgi:hypothetical protein
MHYVLHFFTDSVSELYGQRLYFAGSSPDEIFDFFLIYLILPAALGPGVDSATSRTEYQKIFLGSRARPLLKADNLTAICELIV